MKKYRIKVMGITCASCTSSIENSLKQIPNLKIHSFNSNVALETITVEVDDDVDIKTLTKAIENVGFDVGKIAEVDSLTPFLMRAGIAGGAGLLLLILSLTGLVIPLYGLIIIGIATLPIMIFAGYKIFKNAYKALRYSNTITMDALFSVSSIIAYGVSIFSLAFPAIGLPMFFPAALMILGFRNLGIAIDKKAKRSLIDDKQFIDRTPANVTVAVGNNQGLLGSTTIKDIREVYAGDIIKVSAGDTIPLDGKIIKGNANIKNTIWTGDLHAKKTQGKENVFAGMEVVDGELFIKVSKEREQSLLARIDKQIVEAQDNKPKIEQLTSTVVKFFVPAVILIAVLSGIFVSIFVSPPTALITSVSVLCVACPCVFGWLVPLTMQLSITKAAKHNAFFAKAQAMQNLNSVDTVVFDKTGTLTELSVVEINSHERCANELLHIAHTLEKDSKHIFAHAVQDYANKKSIDTIKDAKDVTDHHKLGRAGTINDKNYVIGNARLMKKIGVPICAYRKQADKLHEDGKTALFIAENDVVIGIMILQQQVKKDVKQNVAQLRRHGIKHIKLCTGSDKDSAIAVAKEIGISEKDVIAEQNPEQKLALVRELQKEKHVVAYVGDGGNDAIAMSGSDVSFVMSRGDSICKNKADVILPDNSLDALTNAFTISRQTMRNMKLNLGLTIAFNFIMISIAAGAFIPLGFTLTPAIAAAFMIGQALMVLFSTYCFKHQPVSLAHKPKATVETTNKKVKSSQFVSNNKSSDLSLSCCSKPDSGKNREYSPNPSTACP